MILQNRIVVAFNKFYSNFIKDVKATNDSIRGIVKKNYKILDKMSDEYIVFYKGQIGEFLPAIINNDIASLSSNEELLSKTLVKDVTIEMVLEGLESEMDKNIFWNYVFILSVIVLIKNEFDVEGEAKQVDDLFTSVISILSKIQNGEEYEGLVSDIVDDDIRSLLSKINNFREEAAKTAKTSKTSKTESSKSGSDPFGMMGDSMICNLAKEISNEIDVSSINIEKPEDVLKMMDFSSSNNVVSDIIKKVSSKIHDRISTGEIKQDDLFGEAMKMMSMLSANGGGGGGAGGDNPLAGLASMMGGGGAGGDNPLAGLASMMGGGAGGGGLGNLLNNPMMSEMMKAMKKGKAVPKQDVKAKMTARDRLRTKLEERRSKSGVSEQSEHSGLLE